MFWKENTHLSSSFAVNTIARVEELASHDLIYIYHHIKVGSKVHLHAAGTNVKGDLRYRVEYKSFVLGFITLSGAANLIYDGVEKIEGVVSSIEKKKFLPIQGLDVSLRATKMRMVS